MLHQRVFVHEDQKRFAEVSGEATRLACEGFVMYPLMAERMCVPGSGKCLAMREGGGMATRWWWKPQTFQTNATSSGGTPGEPVSYTHLTLPTKA